MKHELESITERSGVKLWDFERVMNALPDVSVSGPWLAGGSLRRLLSGTDIFESDFDFFFANEEQAAKFEADLTKACPQLKRLGQSSGAVTYRGKVDGFKQELTVQLVKIAYFENITAALDAFDFTVCQFGWDGEELHCGEFALWDLGRKRLAVHKVTYAVATVRRLVKYTKQGFLACEGCITAILKAVAEKPEIIHSEVEYVD